MAPPSAPASSSRPASDWTKDLSGDQVERPGGNSGAFFFASGVGVANPFTVGQCCSEWRREAPVKRVALAAVVAASLFSLCAAGCASQSKPSEVAGDGWAKVNCAVAPNGGLSDCRIVKEHPEGAGFGEAVLKAAASGRFSAPSGSNVGARVEFTTRFRLD
jgi:TonB family protein